MNKQQPKLLDQLSGVMRLKHYSLKTEKSYVPWVRRFIFFHNKRYPQKMGAFDIQSFLSYLAVNQHVAASTHNQALNALVFLYKHVIKMNLVQLTLFVHEDRKDYPLFLYVRKLRRFSLFYRELTI